MADEMRLPDVASGDQRLAEARQYLMQAVMSFVWVHSPTQNTHCTVRCIDLTPLWHAGVSRLMLFHMPLPSVAGSEYSRDLANKAPMGMRTDDMLCGSGLIDRRLTGKIEESSSAPRTALCTGTSATGVTRHRGPERAGGGPRSICRALPRIARRWYGGFLDRELAATIGIGKRTGTSYAMSLEVLLFVRPWDSD